MNPAWKDLFDGLYEMLSQAEHDVRVAVFYTYPFIALNNQFNHLIYCCLKNCSTRE
jgi:hypothetical protein